MHQWGNFCTYEIVKQGKPNTLQATFCIPPSVSNGVRSAKGWMTAIAIALSIVIFGIFGFVVSGYFGGSEFGLRLMQAVRSFRVGRWWQNVLLITVIVLGIDLISGLLQVWVAKISRT